MFGLYSVVALIYNQLPADRRVRATEGPGKVGLTFADALTAVRRWIRAEGVFTRVQDGSAIEKLPDALREVLYSALAPAA